MPGQKLEISQDADSQSDTTVTLFQFFRNEIEEATPTTISGYNKAIACYQAYQATGASATGTITPRDVRNWLVYMASRPLTPKTILTYYTRLAPLCGKAAEAGLLPRETADEFRRLKPIILAYNPRRQPSQADTVSLQRLQRFFATLHLAKDPDTRTYGNLMLVSLLTGATSPYRIARLKQTDLDKTSQPVREILSRILSPSRRYIFPFGQSVATPRQLERKINAGLRKLLEDIGISVGRDVTDTLRAHWAYAALQTGIPGSVIHTRLHGVPDPLPQLTLGATPELFYPADDTPEQINPGEIDRQVAELFTSNPPHWYAMRLRPRVDRDRVETRITNTVDAASRPELFYPCDEIARRVGNHIEYKSRPLLPGILFFRTRATDILPLFREIGDLAWCYTYAGVYARIPSASMALFQQAIGRFTADYEVAPVGTLQLQPGDRVEVVGGPFAGYQGEITAADSTAVQQDLTHPEPNVVYRIRLFGDANDIEWRLRDPRLLKKIE